MSYFSEREQGERPRDSETIAERAWGGIQALIGSRVDDGSFGASYPETCPDGTAKVGTDYNSFAKAALAEIPAFAEPPWFDRSAGVPDTLDILDFVEFCWRTVGNPLKCGYHDYFCHYHLSFDIDAGRDEFRTAVNRIFRRNGLAYELREDGRIERLAPPVMREVLSAAAFRTGDEQLNALLQKARQNF